MDVTKMADHIRKKVVESDDWASQEFADLETKLVPDSGAADTVEGELIRAVGKLIYRYYNDGDYYYEGYGSETAGPSAAFLLDRAAKLHIDGLTQAIDAAQGKEDEEYKKALANIEKIVVDYVRGKEGKHTKNEDDMLATPYSTYAAKQWGSEEEDYDD